MPSAYKKREKKIRPVRVEGDIAYVTLSRGLVAIIDAADAEAVGQYNWHATPQRYAARTLWKKGPVMLHRFLMQPPPGLLVDHADRDPLNNRRSNLRFATNTQNQANRAATSRNKLGVKGVVKTPWGYAAYLAKRYLGSFRTIEEAKAAYAEHARILFGEFARTE